MKQFFAFAGSLAAMTLLSACSTCAEDPCVNPELPVRSLEIEYGCPDTRRQVTINSSQTYTIIRSQAEFNRLVTSNCRPQVDFNAYDLVIGKKWLPNGNSGIRYTLQRDCTTNQATLRVVFQQGLLTVVEEITYHALVPKLAPGEDVKVDIEVKEAQLQ